MSNEKNYLKSLKNTENHGIRQIHRILTKIMPSPSLMSVIINNAMPLMAMGLWCRDSIHVVSRRTSVAERNELVLSRLEQKWFISVRGKSEKNAIEVSRCCGLRAQPGSRYLQ